VLAGPNGVGKTRLIEALLQFFQNPGQFAWQTTPTGRARIRLVVDATSQTERTEWTKGTLDTQVPADAQLLVRTLQKARSRANWRSSVLNFESDRTIQQVNPLAFTWDSQDPWQENMGWNVGLGGLRARFQDTMHGLFRKVRSRRDQITQRVEDLMRSSKASGQPAPSDLFNQLEQDSPLRSPRSNMRSAGS